MQIDQTFSSLLQTFFLAFGNLTFLTTQCCKKKKKIATCTVCIYSKNVAHIILSDIRSMYAGPL